MTGKRFSILYGIDENPFEWDIMDNEKNALICQCNGVPICDLLNDLAEENEQLKNELNFFREPILFQGNIICDLSDRLNILKKENDQLKQRIEELEE